MSFIRSWYRVNRSRVLYCLYIVFSNSYALRMVICFSFRMRYSNSMALMSLNTFRWVCSWARTWTWWKTSFLLFFHWKGWSFIHHNLFFSITSLKNGYYLRKSIGASLSVLILVLEPIVKPILFLVFNEN